MLAWEDSLTNQWCAPRVLPGEVAPYLCPVPFWGFGRNAFGSSAESRDCRAVHRAKFFTCLRATAWTTHSTPRCAAWRRQPDNASPATSSGVLHSRQLDCFPTLPCGSWKLCMTASRFPGIGIGSSQQSLFVVDWFPRRTCPTQGPESDGKAAPRRAGANSWAPASGSSTSPPRAS
jgi:hypothetical protein